MFVCVISLLFCASVSAIPNGRREVTYPSLETLRSGIKIVKFRAFGEDIELKLEPAGDVISDNFTMKDNLGRIQTTDEKSLKSRLFKAREKGAALYINEDGFLKIKGVINSKLSIEPYNSDKMVKHGISAHVITESFAERKHFNDKVMSMNLKKTFAKDNARIFNEDQCVSIKYLFLTDSNFRSGFPNPKDMETYFATMFILVQEDMDTLKLNIKVSLIGIEPVKNETNFVKESLIPGEEVFDFGHVVGNLNVLNCKYKDNELYKKADSIMFITKRLLGNREPDGSVSTNTLGVANLGGACNPCLKTGVIKDYGDMTLLANTVAHETAHQIGSPHDGEDAPYSLPGSPTGEKCPGSQGYLMGDSKGENKGKFSPCTRENVKFFLNKDEASCVVSACKSTV
uniref:Metalloserrulase 4 n=1 Tax=Tityus serrulatus TaxID=6887 RepID=A0A076L332_TITSE|nr:metalloserrulase 4 [Tityus serrulatus]